MMMINECIWVEGYVRREKEIVSRTRVMVS